MKEQPDILADKNASDIGSENLNAEQIELQKQRKQDASKGKEDGDKAGQKQSKDGNRKSGEQECDKGNP